MPTSDFLRSKTSIEEARPGNCTNTTNNFLASSNNKRWDPKFFPLLMRTRSKVEGRFSKIQAPKQAGSTNCGQQTVSREKIRSSSPRKPANQNKSSGTLIYILQHTHSAIMRRREETLENLAHYDPDYTQTLISVLFRRTRQDS